MAPYLFILKQGGTSSRKAHCDLVWVHQDFSTGRFDSTPLTPWTPFSLTSANPIFSKAKAADQSIASSTTLTNDTDLQVVLEGGHTYAFDLLVFVEIDVSGDYKLDLNYTGTATTVKYSMILNGVNTSYGTTNTVQTGAVYDAFNDEITIPVTVATPAYIRLVGTLTTTTAGTLSVRHAQITSNASASTVKANSMIRVERIWGGWGGDISGAVVVRTTLQTCIVAGTIISWDTEIQDTEGYWSDLNPTYLTIPTAGWYTVIGTVKQSGDADDVQRLGWKLNGGALTNTQHSTRGGISTTIVAESQVVALEYFSAGDYLELFVENRAGNSTVYARASIIRHGGATGPQGAQGLTGSTGEVALIYCDTDEDRASTTVLAEDPVLQAVLVANTNYRLEFDIYMTTGSTPDFKYDLNFAGVATSVLVHSFHAAGWTTASLPTGDDSTTFSSHGATALNVVRTYAIGGSETVPLRIIVTIQVGATGGVFSFRWAQGTSSATLTTRRKDSTLRIERYTGYGSLSIDDEIAADSPRGYWKLDEASGNLADSSGNGHTLTVTGAPITAYQFQAADGRNPTRKTLVATGGNQTNYAADAVALGVSLPITTYTMEVWGKWTSTGILMAIGSSGETTATNFSGQLRIEIGGLLETFWEYGAGTNGPTITSILGGAMDGLLHHLVLVKDAATTSVKYYIDGQYVGGGTYSGAQEHTGGTSNVFSIIGTPGENTSAPDGLYAGAAFYTAALTEARIQAHARALGLF
jgi:hypothetical protein